MACVTDEVMTMVARNFVLSETQDQLVRALVASGRYHNVSEARLAGLWLLEQEEMKYLRIQQSRVDGIGSAERGELAEGGRADAIRRAFARRFATP